MASYWWCISVALDNGLVPSSHQPHTWTTYGTFCTVLMHHREKRLQTILFLSNHYQDYFEIITCFEFQARSEWRYVDYILLMNAMIPLKILYVVFTIPFSCNQIIISQKYKWNAYIGSNWSSIHNKIYVTPLWQNISVTTSNFYNKYNIDHLWIWAFFWQNASQHPPCGVNFHLRISLYTGRAGSFLRPFEYELSFTNST